MEKLNVFQAPWKGKVIIITVNDDYFTSAESVPQKKLLCNVNELQHGQKEEKNMCMNPILVKNVHLLLAH